MTIQELSARALTIRAQFEAFEKQKWGRAWTTNDIAVGLMGDLGDLVKLMQAKEGIRPAIENIDEQLRHELADCLWCIFVLANKYNIDIEKTFLSTMDDLEKWITTKEAVPENQTASNESSQWQKRSSTYVHENPWYKVRQDVVVRPDGKEGTYNVVECGASVFIVPITTDGKILLVKIFRYTTQHEGWEVPAGGVEPGEKPLAAAKRELQEECGFASTSWQEFGTFDLMNGISNATAHVYEAKGLTATKHHEQGEEGITKVAAFTPEQVLDMIQKGHIVDALSIAALMRVLRTAPPTRASGLSSL